MLRAGEDAAEIARRADAQALGVAGGDGSLAAVAAVAIEHGSPFVCIPFGTHNHFARDLGLDRGDPFSALSAFEGVPQKVDVGRVGERLFLNNVSLGLYAHLVHRRERHRKRRTALAQLRALLLLLRQREPVALAVDGVPVSGRVILVANNRYALDVMSIGERERLDGGLLHLYVAEGWLPRSWVERTGTLFTVDARPSRLRATVDGEPETLELPLEFRILPRALTVLLPHSPG